MCPGKAATCSALCVPGLALAIALLANPIRVLQLLENPCLGPASAIVRPDPVTTFDGHQKRREVTPAQDEPGKQYTLRVCASCDARHLA